MSEKQPLSDRLVDLLYPEGQDPAELASLRRQVEADPELSEKLRQYETVRRVVAELPVPEPERAVHYEILRQARAAAAAEEADGRKGSLWAWFTSLHIGPALAGAVGLLLAVGGTMMLTREDAPEARAPAQMSSPVAAPREEGSLGRQGGAPSFAATPAPATTAPPSMAAAPASEAPSMAAWAAPASAAPAAVAPPPAAARAMGGKGANSLSDPFAEKDSLGAIGAGRGGGGSRADQNAFPGLGADRPAEAPAAKPKPAPRPATANAAPPPPPEDLDDGIVYGVQAEQKTESLAQGGERARDASKEARGPAPSVGGPAPRPAREAEESSTRAGDGAAPEGAELDVAPMAAVQAPVVQEPQAPAGAAQAPMAPPPPPAEPAPDASPVQTAAAPKRAEAAKKAKAPARPAAETAAADEATSETTGSGGISWLDAARKARQGQQWRIAVRNYETFLEKFPRHAEMSQVLYETADAYERLGETARALELYRLVASSGGAAAGRAMKRIEALESERRKMAAPPAKAAPQAAPATDYESQSPEPAERK